MAFIEWNDSIKVGIRTIDEQHKQLVDMINMLHEAMAAGKGNLVLNEIFARLVAYTRTHFATEEELFKRYMYPEFADHKREHDELIQSVLILESQFASKKLGVSIKTANMLKDWLTNHIMKTDKKYVEFLNSRGVH